MSLWSLILLLLVFGFIAFLFLVRHAKKTDLKVKSIAKRHSVLAAILWVASGIGIVWGIAIFIHSNVQRIQGGQEVGISIVVIGTLLGLIGYRVTRPRFSLNQPSEEIAEAKPDSPPPCRVSDTPKKTIFVSYRRDDSADVTGRIYDRLSSRFGTDQVFKDVDSIPLGRDFREVIHNAVAKASVVIVVIGKNWVGRDQGVEHPRIQDQTDFVRTEVAAALQQDKPVIPVLVANAKMPSESELPDDIKPFAYRNGVNVRPDPDFGHDVERLIKGIEQA